MAAPGNTLGSLAYFGPSLAYWRTQNQIEYASGDKRLRALQAAAGFAEGW